MSSINVDNINEYTTDGKVNVGHDIKLASGKSVLNSDSKSIGSLVKIASGTFSSVGSLTVSDVFTTDYRHYQISIEYVGANGSVGGSANIDEFRMTNSGTNYTTANYHWGQYIMRFATDNEYENRGVDAQYWRLNGYGTSSGNQHFHTIQMMNPAHTARTQFTAHSILDEVDQEHFIMQGGTLSATTAFDGFSINVQGSGDMTGSYSVYGVN